MPKRKDGDMNVRKIISYGENGQLIYAAALLKEMIQEIDILMKDYSVTPEEENDLNQLKQKCQNLLEKHESFYEVGRRINKELLLPENAEYAWKHKEFPPHASPTFDEMNAGLQECFELEDRVAETVVARIWKEETEKEVDYTKGKNFYHVVHSGPISGVVLPGSPRFQENSWFSTSYISCSLLTGNHMDMYNSNVGIEFYVDKDSLVCASRRDCATSEVTRQNIRTIQKVRTMDKRKR